MPFPRKFDPVPTNSWLFLRSLGMALGRPQLWLMTGVYLLLISLPVALPWVSWFEQTVPGRYAPGSTVASLDEVFRQDHGEALGLLRNGTARAGAVLSVLAVLLGIFAAGGWLQVILERTRGQSLRRFFHGGSRYFWRFLRFWVLLMLVLAGLHWVVFGWPWERVVLQALMGVPASDSGLESLDSEYTVAVLTWTQHGLGALGFALAMAWATYTRTRMALHDQGSALWGGLLTLFVMLRHPIRTLRPLVLLFLVEFALVSLLAGGLTRMVEERLVVREEGGPALWHVAALAGLGIAALCWREITRGARYHAAAAVSREAVKPLSRPDPWKAIGGPGGPQYPTEGGDEYSVAM